MTSRELFNGVMSAVDTQGTQIAALAEQNARIERKIEGLLPRSDLPMISRPVQGVDYGRTCNVAEYVDRKIRAHNSNVPENAPRYLEFASERSHDDLNRSALLTIGGIIARKFGDNYGGYKTWEKLHKARPKSCEEIIEEARLRPEFHVFSQVDGQWCLREFAKNKVKSLFRTSRAQRQSEIYQNSEHQAAQDGPNVQDSAPPQIQSNISPAGAQGTAVLQSPVLVPSLLQQNMDRFSQDAPVTEQERNTVTAANGVRDTSSRQGVVQQIGNANLLANNHSSDIEPTSGMPASMQSRQTTACNQLPVAAVQPVIVRTRTRTPRSGLSSRNVRTRRQ